MAQDTQHRASGGQKSADRTPTQAGVSSETILIKAKASYHHREAAGPLKQVQPRWCGAESQGDDVPRVQTTGGKDVNGYKRSQVGSSRANSGQANISRKRVVLPATL